MPQATTREDNPRFGLNDWQAEWDGVQDEYQFGADPLPARERRIAW